jgi:hypothetical protein
MVCIALYNFLANLFSIRLDEASNLLREIAECMEFKPRFFAAFFEGRVASGSGTIGIEG